MAAWTLFPKTMIAGFAMAVGDAREFDFRSTRAAAD
jgi:hypothetical protein